MYSRLYERGCFILKHVLDPCYANLQPETKQFFRGLFRTVSNASAPEPVLASVFAKFLD